MTNPSWTAQFPGLAALEPETAASLLEHARVVRAPAGAHIFTPGQSPSNYLLLISGSVRVQKASESGREIVLYRVGSGESCVLTTACLVGHEEYQAEGIAETDVEAAALPRADFDSLVARSQAFRQFVFTSFGSRVTSLLRLIDEVAFARVDIRLALKLIELARDGGTIAMTQQQLAAELGTAREVISRQLQEFQRQGWIALARGSIEIIKPDALRNFARTA